MSVNIQEFEGAVAVVDVLGFCSKMRRLPHEQVCNDVVGVLHSAFQWARQRFRHDLRRTPSSRLESLFFSDTLVAMLARQDETIHDTAEVVMESMVFVCQVVMAMALAKGIAIRGAISYGKGVVCREPLFYVGQPFLEAHRLEKQQNWAGISLSEDASRLIGEDDRRTLIWEVPTKQYRAEGVVHGISEMRAINWPPLVRASQLLPDWDACFSGAADNPDVLTKLENTRCFFDSSTCIGAEGLVAPLDEWCQAWQARHEQE